MGGGRGGRREYQWSQHEHFSYKKYSGINEHGIKRHAAINGPVLNVGLFSIAVAKRHAAINGDVTIGILTAKRDAATNAFS